ncbi:hypothetical protein AK34_4262 [Burkholderia dolosa AU0158]|nr:hypothetical protein AK34_4262 [Burkholderia dolosa AU0158]VWB63554.1 hypothetical protein BDO18943_02951 [Burkholderia dolosa]
MRIHAFARAAVRAHTPAIFLSHAASRRAGVGQGGILARAQVVVASVVQRDVEQLHAFAVREFALGAPLSRHTHAVAFEVESVSAARI